MSCNTSIEEYNQKLVNDKINIAIVDYVKAVNDMKYKIDISFIDELLELVNKDECCIHHIMMNKYGILTINDNTTGIILRTFKQYNFVENEDFRLYNIVQSASNGGCTHKNEYYLHPRAFKMCLMRSKNTKVYARYYILLEECIKHYNDYQILLRDTYNIKLKDKIKENKIIINQISTENKELHIKIDKVLENNNQLLEDNKKLLTKLDETNNKLDHTNEQLEDIQDELSEVKDELRDTTIKLDISLEDRVPKTKSIQIREYFVLLQTINNREKYKYYVLRG